MKASKYTELPIWNKLVSKILVYYATVWSEKKLNTSHHTLWLNNFQDNERLSCLYLLSKFMFFGQDEIRALLISIYRDKFKYKIVENIRMTNANTTDTHFINRQFLAQLNTTRFVALGGASESGSALLYTFRQMNNLPVRNMKNSSEIFNGTKLQEPTVNKYIFIDDFCGSGETAIKCNPLIKEIKKNDPSIIIDYYVLFAAEQGLQNVSSDSYFDNAEAIFKIDSSFKCFEKSSRYFNESHPEINQATTRTFATKYGISLVKGTPIEGHPLGFDDGQLLIAFSHNTPDNSLPIFWSDKKWEPFFKRFIKIL